MASSAPRLFDGLERRSARKQRAAATAAAASASSVKPQRIKSFNTVEQFPMFLLPIAALLELDELKPHQELFDQLVPYEHDAHSGRVIFISHQWTGWQKPDPGNAQLRALQATLSKLMSGKGGDVQSKWSQQLLMGNSA